MLTNNVNKLAGDKLFQNSKKPDPYISTLKPKDMGYFSVISFSRHSACLFSK